MSYSHDINEKIIVVNAIDHAIITHSQTP